MYCCIEIGQAECEILTVAMHFVLYFVGYSALIEIMPLGYNDFSFSLLADTCHVWFYELQGVRPPSKLDVSNEMFWVCIV